MDKREEQQDLLKGKSQQKQLLTYSFRLLSLFELVDDQVTELATAAYLEQRGYKVIKTRIG